MAAPPLDTSPGPFLRGHQRGSRAVSESAATQTPSSPPPPGLHSGTWTPAQQRPAGRTPTLSTRDAQRLLVAPDPRSLQGLRDRAILAVGLYLGATRTEIVALCVRDFQVRGGFDCLRLPLTRATRRLPVPPQVARRIRDYLAADGHAGDSDAPLFRLVRRSSRRRNGAASLRPSMVDQIVRKYCTRLGLGRGYAALSLRATYLSPAMQEMRGRNDSVRVPPSRS